MRNKTAGNPTKKMSSNCRVKSNSLHRGSTCGPKDRSLPGGQPISSRDANAHCYKILIDECREILMELGDAQYTKPGRDTLNSLT